MARAGHGQLFCDDSAQDIIDMLRTGCDDGHVSWAMPCKIEAISTDSARTKPFHPRYQPRPFRLRKLVATGGLSIPRSAPRRLG